MPKSDRSRVSRFVTAGPLVMAILATLVVAPVVNAGESPPKTLASASDGRTLKLGDIASDDNLVGVVFQERNLSYVRWSKNYGQSFGPKVALRDGLRAKDPRVATCDDLVFAVSSWQTATSRNVGVEFRNVVSGEKGKYSLGPGYLADISCYGEVAGVTWVDNDHLWLAVHELGCASPCNPTVKLDLGTGDFDSPPRITSDYEGFTVAWVTTGLTIQHFDYSADGPLLITPESIVTLMAGKDVHTPEIASLGQRVVVAYERNGQTHLRISDDLGASFGPRIIVSNYCRDCPEGGSRPDSVAVRGSDILVEVVRAGGVPAAYEMVGFVSRNSGDSWAMRSSRGGGFQRGVLLGGATFAEAWDAHFYNGYPYPETEQLIGFQVRDL